MKKSRSVAAMLNLPLALSLCLCCGIVCGDLDESRCLLGPKAGTLTVESGMDASGRDLRGSVFIGLDLKAAIFDGCELEDVKFYQCDLRDASFKGTRLTGMVLGDCDLRGADLTDAIVNDIQPVHGGQGLSGELLRATRSYKWGDLTNCAISVATTSQGKPFELDFRKKNLGNSRISGDLRRCRFDDARVGQLHFVGCEMEFSQLSSTNTYKQDWLQGTRFSSVRFGGTCDFSGKNLRGCEFLDVTDLGALDAQIRLVNADIRECTFRRTITKTHLASTRSYQEGRLCGVRLHSISLRSFDFSGVNLTGAAFGECDLTGAQFDDAVITDIDFADYGLGPVSGLTVEQIKSTWNYKHGRMRGIVLPQEIAKALEEE